MREKEIGLGPSGSEVGLREIKVSACSASGLARLLLAFVSLYIASSSFAVYFWEVQRPRFYNLYYLAVVSACALLTLVSLREVNFQRFNFKLRGLIRPLVLLAVGSAAWALYRYPHLFAHSLWIDEITQFQGDWNLPRTVADPAIFAAIQQQPPADYYLSAFARIVLGASEFSVQIHAIVFGILSLLMFLVWLAKIRFPLLLAPVPIVLFAAHHTLLRFSSEARPVSLAVFFSITALIFAFESFQNRKASIRLLCASSVLLLYSIGLQPIFFLCALGVGFSPVLFRYLERAEAVKFLLAFSLVPLIVFSPTLWEIYRESARQNQFFAASYVEIWWGAMKALKWQDFKEFFRTIRGAEWVALVPCLTLPCAFWARATRLKKLPDGAEYWALAGIIFSTLFPLAFQVFWSIINWNQNLYYFVLWPVGLFALGSLSVAQLLSAVPLEKKWIRFGMALVGLVSVALLQWNYVPNHRMRVEHDHSFRPNWHEVVKLAKKSKNPALILEIPYGSYGWPPYHSITGQFYENPPDLRVVRLERWHRSNFGIPPFRIYEPLAPLEGRSDIFYLITLMDDPGSRIGEERKQKILSLLRENADEVVQVQASNYLVKMLGRSSPLESTTSLFKKIVESDSGGDRNFYLADALTAEAIRKRDCVGARKWFSIMKITEYSAASNESLKKHLAEMKKKINLLPRCVGG